MQATRAPAANPWILDAPRDLIWFIATPLLIVPLIALVNTRLDVVEIGIYVAAFGATGHHLPGLLRAYGDRELFDRFRLRFIAAPLLLLICCVGLANTDLKGLGVIVLLWGTWHGLAQVFGMLRIYDAKARSHAPLTIGLDRWLLIAWFGGGLLHSPGRMASLLETFYAGGVPLLSAGAIDAFTTGWDFATAGVTLAFAANGIRSTRRGAAPSPLKLPLLVTSIGFWWYAMVWIDNVILGIALFELFHDVQYLSVSWVFNRNRVDKGHRMARFARFLFRPSPVMIALYVTGSMLYGYSVALPGLIESDTVRRSLLGLVATSALLHFYYDGFIWKIRERSTRESLGLSGGGASEVGWLHRGFGHALLWSLFVIPLGALALSQLRGLEPQLAQRRNIADAAPSAYSHASLGLALMDAGQLDEAVEWFRSAVALDPDSAPARHKLGVALRDQGHFDEAIEQHRRAVELSAGRWERHEALGDTFAAAGRRDAAIEQYRIALAAEPDATRVQERLAVVLTEAERPADAVEWYEALAAGRPDSWQDAYNLAVTLTAAGRQDEAVPHFERAIALAPEAWQPQQGLGLAYRQRGRAVDAQRHLQIAASLRRSADSR